MIRFFFILLALISYWTYGQDCSPTLREIYDFEIGSTFQYLKTNSNMYGGEQEDNYFIEKFTIEDFWVQNDTIGIVRQGLSMNFGIIPNSSDTVKGTTEDLYDTIIIVDSSSHYLNACDSQLVFLDLDNDLYSKILIENVNGRLEKSIGGYFQEQPNLYKYNENDSLVVFMDFDIHEVFAKGLGKLISDLRYFEVIEREELMGYVIDNDTTGIIWSDEWFSSVEHHKDLNNTHNIYPTVIGDDNLITIDIPSNYHSIDLYSTKGLKINFELNSENQIHLQETAPGVYFMFIKYSDYSISRKLIKF